MAIKKKASAQWEGGLKDGNGTLTTQSGALSGQPYTFAQRFEGAKGTNPEELIGAAHAGCFLMALSKILGEEGLTARMLRAEAEVTLDQKDGDFAVTASHLALTGRVDDTDADTFGKLANKAKEGCPISRLLDAEITLDATLEG